MENNNTQSNQEIDLIYLFKKLNDFISNLGYQLFRFVRFVIKNIFILLGLIIIGILLGIYIQKTIKNSYKNNITVISNFESSDYLYSIIKDYRKIEVKNTNEEILLNNIIDIEITPIIDINNYINNPKKRDFFKILTENGIKINDFLENDEIKKSTNKFIITFFTKNKKYSKNSIDFILNHYNNSKYYLEKGKIEVKNLEKSKKELNQSIEQINNILNNFETNRFQESKNQLSINTYQNLNEIINLKNIYLENISDIDKNLITYNKIIYPINGSYNNEFSDKFYYNPKVLYPIILVLIFFIINILIRFYNKYRKIESSIK